MAIPGYVKFNSVTPQTYTGKSIIPNKNDVFIETYDFETVSDGTIISVTNLEERVNRTINLECSNNIDVGTANITIDPSGQFKASGTFEIISDVLVNITGLKRFKEKIENVISETYETQNNVDKKIANLVNSAPETLDTLGELATALQENANVVDVLNSSISNKANKSELDTTNTNVTELSERVTELENKGGGTTIETYSITFNLSKVSSSTTSNSGYLNNLVTISEVTKEPKFVAISLGSVYAIATCTGFNFTEGTGLKVFFTYLSSVSGNATLKIYVFY